MLVNILVINVTAMEIKTTLIENCLIGIDIKDDENKSFSFLYTVYREKNNLCWNKVSNTVYTNDQKEHFLMPSAISDDIANYYLKSNYFNL